MAFPPFAAGRFLLLAACLLRASAAGAAGTPRRYCNPLPVEHAHEAADPTVIRFKDRYYLFMTGGMAWVSDDLVDWKYRPVSLPGGRTLVAPDACEIRGELYLCGNGTGLYRSQDPLSGWTYLGDFKDEKGKVRRLFDPAVFADDDGRVYLYYSGMHTDGIWGVELDAKNLTQFAGPARRLWTYDRSHVWERWGDRNEYTEISWLEAPWMTKHEGVYHLQYSASATTWKTYAVGAYTSRHPLGPFTYAPRNPVLVHRNGLINGTGHHAIVRGPDDRLWCFYSLLFRNWNRFDRRIGMDPVEFDAQGNLWVAGPTDTPQPAPGTTAPAGEPSRAISIDRITWQASSAAPGRDPHYAFDDNVRTWWEPAPSDPEPSLMIDLGDRNPDDPRQDFIVDSVRLLFDAAPHPRTSDLTVSHTSRWYRGLSRGKQPGPYRYRIEVSSDNRTYRPVVDKTANERRRNIEFDEITPLRTRYVRLTVVGAPKDVPWGVLEFTVFGKPVNTREPPQRRGE